MTLDPQHPEGAPLIDPGIFQDKADLATLIKAFPIGWELMMSEPFAPFRAELAKPKHMMQSEEEIERYILQTVESVYHTVGTCSMGTGKDAVVDAELKVHGVKNLRVADASIMPRIPSGNVNAAIMMVAEKAATMMQDY